MTIYVYSIPAMLALIAKLFILYFSHCARTRNLQTCLFTATVLFSIALSVAEVTGFQRLFASSPHYEGIVYYAASIPMVALLVHLVISIAFDNWRARHFFAIYVFIYGYALVLEGLLLFTRWLVAGMEDFNGYTITRIPGPLYWLYEVFIVASCLAMLLLPIWGLRTAVSATVRSKCKLWIAACAPLALLVIAIVTLLHFEIRWFNATVTTPLLIALLMATIGYAVHSPRIIELDFYFPWSKARKLKNRLYERLAALGTQAADSPQTLIDRLAKTLKCPVSVIASRLVFASSGAGELLSSFPRQELRKIDHMLVASEINGLLPDTHALLKKHHVAAVVPFYPHSRIAASWLLLGESFSQSVYTPRDFQALEGLLTKMADLFLDKALEMENQTRETQRKLQSMQQQYTELKHELDVVKQDLENDAEPQTSLEACVAEFESKLIKRTLILCEGNQAEAARRLGLRPNTLYYKLKKYSLK